MATMMTMGNYSLIKHWDEWPAWKATKRSEVGRLGALVSEPYLDETGDRLGRTLMTKCRARSLPVMARVRDEMNLPAAKGICPMCSSGQEETVEHLLATCTAYARERMRMETRVQAMLGIHVTTNNAMSTQGQVNLLLGGPGAWRRGAVAARMASKATQRFLKQAWRRRRQVTRRINEELDRHDLVDAGDAPTEKFRQAEARDFVRQAEREGGVHVAKRRQGLRANIASVEQGRLGARRMLAYDMLRHGQSHRS